MYENQTYEVIMARLLSNVPSDIDKSEGSFIWDALSPAALELAQAYIAIDSAINQSFIGTATDDYLERGAAEMGVTRFAASFAIGEVTLTGAVGTLILAGTLLSTIQGTQFKTSTDATIGEDGTITAPIKAVVAGVVGIVPAGTITVIPISVNGLTSVNNTASTYGGENEETDEELRTRYFTEISQRSEDGNIAQYVKWAAEYMGIGRSKILPLWNGANTVKISILDAINKAASQDLINAFQMFLDPDNSGLGNGAAPIGAIVTVTTATELIINVAATIALASGYTEATGVQEAIVSYFADIAYRKTTVSYLGLAACVLACNSVDQLQSITLNSGTADITLTSEQIPVLGTFTPTVVTA